MLLALESPTCAADLDAVTECALAVLDHVVSTDADEWEGLVAELDWLPRLRVPKAARAAIERLLQQPCEVREAVAMAARADAALSVDDGCFDFSWPTLSDSTFAL